MGKSGLGQLGFEAGLSLDLHLNGEPQGWEVGAFNGDAGWSQLGLGLALGLALGLGLG